MQRQKYNMKNYLGSYVIPPGNSVRGKTFVLYKLPKDGYVVENYYGNEYVNERKYKNEAELKKDYDNGLKDFVIYHYPFAP